MSVRKIRHWWWVDFRVNFTRYRKRSPENSRSGAMAYELVLRQRLARGESLDRPVATPKVMFSDFVAEWFDTYVKGNNKPSEQRRKGYVIHTHLGPFFGSRDLESITSQDIERYKAAILESGLCAKTVNNHLSVLGKCLASAHDWGRLRQVPTFHLLKAESRRIDFLTDAEVAALIAEHSEPTWHRMVVTALHAGLRLGELFALDWGDVDLTSHLLAIRRSMVNGIVTDTKSHHARYVPMTSLLERTLIDDEARSGPVFRPPRCAHFTYSNARHALHRICRRAGIRLIGWHVLRHTFASHLVGRGASLRSTQLLLGHSTVLMTERYAHLTPSHLRQAIAVLERTDALVDFGQPVGNAAKVSGNVV